MSRIIIVGGPRTGKSTMARGMRERGMSTWCGDPLSLVKDKEKEDGVMYLPEFDDLPKSERWSAGSLYVALRWFGRPGNWCCEGQIMARALRKWMRDVAPTPLSLPADKIIVLRSQHEDAVTLPGQRSMHKAVMTVWDEIAWRFAGIAEERI